MNKLKQYREYLKVLAIFHYVVGGMYGLITLTSIFGYFAIFSMFQKYTGFPPEELEQQRQLIQQMTPMIILFAIGGIIFSIATIISGRMIQKRKYYWFSFVIAVIMIFYFEGFGAQILGILTIIVLLQETTKQIYSYSSETLPIQEIEKEEAKEPQNLNQGINTESDTDATGGVIPYKNPKALISYYLGILSSIPFIGIISGIISIILGIQGLKDYKTNPNIRGRIHSSIGIGCGSIFVFLWLILSIFLLLQ